MIYIPILKTIQNLLQNETVLSEVYYAVCHLCLWASCMHKCNVHVHACTLHIILYVCTHMYMCDNNHVSTHSLYRLRGGIV